MLERPPYSTESPVMASPAQAAVGQPAGGMRGAPVPMLEISIQRLEEIVDQETAALKAREPIDLKAFNDRKSQALLELTRWLRNVQSVGENPELAARVGRLREKLSINQAVLKVHVEAVREISASLSDALRQAESDGTYTQAISSVARTS